VHNALRCRSRHHFESLSISTSAGVVEVRGPFFTMVTAPQKQEPARWSNDVSQ